MKKGVTDLTIEDAEKRVSIEINDLRYYEAQGLLRLENLGTECPEKVQSELRSIQLIDSLAKIGVGINELKQLKELMDQGEWTKEDQFRILKKCRFKMLDDIHGKQQILDRMDYIIHTMKQN